MSNFEKIIWLGIAGYGVYSAGNAFVDQLHKVERRGPDLLNVLVLAGLGAAFLIRLDSTSEEAKTLFS
jgi:hypothetical protein